MSDTKEQKPTTDIPRTQTPSSVPSTQSTKSDPGKGKYQDPSRFTTNRENKSEGGGSKKGDR